MDIIYINTLQFLFFTSMGKRFPMLGILSIYILLIYLLLTKDRSIVFLFFNIYNTRVCFFCFAAMLFLIHRYAFLIHKICKIFLLRGYAFLDSRLCFFWFASMLFLIREYAFLIHNYAFIFWFRICFSDNTNK